MSYLTRSMLTILALVLLITPSAAPAAPPAKPPKEPAKIQVEVEPGTVSAGQQATVIVRLNPIEGVKINRYPRIKLQLAGVEGIVADSKAEFGSDRPPAPDALDKNYFTNVEPLNLSFRMDDAAPDGKRELEGKVTFNYCMIASGFCSRFSGPIKIPVDVQ
jgi:hypothetical protein